MTRRKRFKFAENQTAQNVLEPGKVRFDNIKGNWNEFFGNHHPIVLELACGRGEYTTGLAQIYPEKNFVGIDIKGDRIWKGSTFAQQNNLQNVAFLRTLIHALENFFEENEVAEIWVIHPDPRPRDKDEKRRLTFPRFLEIYRKILQPEGIFRLKTDNTGLYQYSLEIFKTQKIKDLEHTDNLYQSPLYAEHHGIVTRFEQQFHQKGHDIKYLKCKFLK